MKTRLFLMVLLATANLATAMDSQTPLVTRKVLSSNVDDVIEYSSSTFGIRVRHSVELDEYDAFNFHTRTCLSSPQMYFMLLESHYKSTQNPVVENKAKTK